MCLFSPTDAGRRERGESVKDRGPSRRRQHLIDSRDTLERLTPPPLIPELLERHQPALESMLRREARGLLLFETVEDLSQGAAARALMSANSFEYRDDEQALGWLVTIARRYIADRHDYWSALRRNAGRVLRLTTSEPERPTHAAIAPAIQRTGPATFAERREIVQFAMHALATLPERDQQLVHWISEGITAREQAERLSVSYDAAQRAGHRALERFRRAFAALGS